MPSTIEILSDSLSFEIECACAYLPITNPTVGAFVNAATNIMESLDLTELSVTKEQAPDTYTYKFVASDGRKWKQTLVVPVGVVPYVMTWVITGAWSTDELPQHRAVRDLVVQMIREHQLTKAEVVPV